MKSSVVKRLESYGAKVFVPRQREYNLVALDSCLRCLLEHPCDVLFHTAAYYGGFRPGDNLFSNTLVALDAKTGKRIWHFQMVHHDLWEYDTVGPATLGEITVGGRRIKAVMQPSKTGFLYVFDRVTGTPVWPIEERPVPQSTVVGEKTSPTQPFPTKPPPYERQGTKEEDLIDFTPELRAEAVEILKQYVTGPLFTPPSIRGPGAGTHPETPGRRSRGGPIRSAPTSG